MTVQLIRVIFWGVEFEEGVVRHVMVSDVRQNSVVATILEEAGRNYPHGRSMAISLLICTRTPEQGQSPAVVGR